MGTESWRIPAGALRGGRPIPGTGTTDAAEFHAAFALLAEDPVARLALRSRLQLQARLVEPHQRKQHPGGQRRGPFNNRGMTERHGATSLNTLASD